MDSLTIDELMRSSALDKEKQLQRRLLCSKIELEDVVKTMSKLYEPVTNESWEDDMAPVLIGHARLYVFGEQHLVYNLKSLALFKLHKVLMHLTVFGTTPRAITELARYVYDNTLTNEGSDDMDPLRKIIVEFVAIHFPFYEQSPFHKDLMREGGDYPVDLLNVVAKWR
ncbi:hypothetical protein BDV96DRAFT_584207 [Lophiotrema nucula]|uniref:BTB domain-containing protein n=1 Tax=Lophiotrema nucula TaxID=690887 RepID=A0A6A5YVD5_9PLEO|nr:hypothetical protein BDV96DRAFT_584207 [Lophiotrema nucula]